MTMMLIAHSSRQFKAGSSRLWVRAFTSSGKATTTRASSLAIPNTFLQRQQHQIPTTDRLAFYSTTSRTLLAAGAQVDEDLDTALDELLASTFDEESTTPPKIEKKRVSADAGKEHHMKDSKPVPSTLLAEVSIQAFIKYK